MLPKTDITKFLKVLFLTYNVRIGNDVYASNQL